jgi:hypothetical protein
VVSRPYPTKLGFVGFVLGPGKPGGKSGGNTEKPANSRGFLALKKLEKDVDFYWNT